MLLVHFGFIVRIFGATLNCVAYFFAALTLLRAFSRCQIDIVLFVLCSMLAELAAGSLLRCLATAPPHFSGPLRLVHSAGPIKVLRIFVVLFAVEAHFSCAHKMAFAHLKFLNPQQQFFLLLFQ